MYQTHCCPGVLSKIGSLALLGVGILFVGPIALGLVGVAVGLVAAVVAVVLPFVVIGGIAYAPYLLARRVFGPRRRTVALKVAPVPPVRPARFEPPAERPAPEPPAPRRRGVVARTVAEVLCGALVGGVLGTVAVVGAMIDWQVSNVLDTAAIGAGIGAMVGFVVGGPRPAPVEKATAMG
jgi:hypothetical protein